MGSDNPEVVFLKMSPLLGTSQEGTSMNPLLDTSHGGTEMNPVPDTSQERPVYYVTTEMIHGKMRLKLTKTRSEALPIGKSSISDVGLPGPLSVFTCDDHGNMEVEASRTRNPGSTTGYKYTFTFVDGKIEVPEEEGFNLYREQGTNLLVMLPGNPGGNQRYEQMVQTDTCLFGNYDPSTTSPTPDGAECKQRIAFNAGLAGVAGVVIPVLFAPPAACILVTGVLSGTGLAAGEALQDLRKIRNASKPQELVRMDLGSSGPAGLPLAGDNI